MTPDNDLHEKEAWTNNLKKKLVSLHGEKSAERIFQDFEPILGYLMTSPVSHAVIDINGIQRCLENGLAIEFELNNEENDDEYIYLNIYSLDLAVDLSDSLAILQSTGLKVFIEKPDKLTHKNQEIWIHRYQAKPAINMVIELTPQLANYFEELYFSCWNNNYAIDPFNQLLFSSCLCAREIQIFRAYAAYAKQIKVTYSARYFAITLFENPQITQLLLTLFKQRFGLTTDNQNITQIEDKFDDLLNDVPSLDHDNILKLLFELIMATCRTNYFKNLADDQQIISFKLQPQLISNIPRPVPEFEIFIYSKRFEGIHLRGGKVARGGLRWSDRQEDFRTEVLGLMKAQMVKNSVIVPTGSKGGFICKHVNNSQNREQQTQEVEQCYRLYIDSLLCITDNLINGKVVHPEKVTILDDDDTYLVVAADKGTSSYSDIANEIAQKHGFWLDDAFASGGSVGYDHKKMGITARGAWESVKRHFRVRGIDCQQQTFSVIGIGDMSGDVFGNGMLLSKKIQLLAAFNHLQIFIDPSPDAASTYKERQRLFKLPRSSWSDFNSGLISEGGGVFNRSSKTISLTPQIQQLLDTKQTSMSPTALIRCILKAKADLLWNGGIGTYIKAESETHLEVQDKANDNLRVNASELNVKMIAEGGNLGITQAGRIEFSLLGGNNYSDAIDNSAGVDCSDHEVNIKILLQQVVTDGKMTVAERNRLLLSMTDEVAALTIKNNFRQTQIIDMLSTQAQSHGYEDSRFISHLENSGVLSRELEGLPSDRALKDRLSSLQQGLTKPEISVLLSYSKFNFKNALLTANDFNNAYFDKILIQYFPLPLRQQYQHYILNHALKNNIMANIVSNQLINHLGTGFGFKMKDEAGANFVQIVKAYLSVIQIFDINTVWQNIENIKGMDENLKLQCLLSLTSLIQRSISWILRTYSNNFEIDQLVEQFSNPAKELKQCIPAVLSGEILAEFEVFKQRLNDHKTPENIIQEFLPVAYLSASFDIVDIALNLKSDVKETATLFYSVAEKLDLEWVQYHVSILSKRNHWHQLAITSMRNEIHRHHKNITFFLLKNSKGKCQSNHAIEHCQEINSFILARYQEKITELKSIRELDYAMLVVAVNELRILLQQLSNQ